MVLENNTSVSESCDISLKLADSPITIEWILDGLTASDQKFQLLNRKSKVSNVTSVDISGGKGFISKVYKIAIMFENDTEPYEVVLKVPGVESFNDAFKPDQKKTNSTTQLQQVAKLHKRECSFYNEIAPKLSIPLVKVFKTQEWTLGKDPGAILMESVVGRGDSCPLSTGANLQQIFEVVKHLCVFQKSIICLAPNEWQGKYDFDMFSSFSKNDLFGQFFQKLKILKPGVFDKGCQELDKFRKNHKFDRYLMCDIYKELGLPAVLSHGDFWNNNVLWKLNLDGSLSNEIVSIIDWQIVHQGCMTNDLARFMAVCVDGEIRREFENDVLQYYYDTLTAMLLEEDKSVDFTLDKVTIAYRANFIHQAIIAMIVGPFLFNYDSLSGDQRRIKKAQMEKVLLRAQLAMEDALEYYKDLPNEVLPHQYE